jgi:hypothetical protein
MIIKESIIINASISKVWDTFTNLTCWIKWNSVMKNVSSEEKCLTNTKNLKCYFRPFIFPIQMRIKVEEIVPYERIVWSARKKGLLAFHEFFFQKNERGILVTSKETFSGLLAGASGFFLPEKRMRSLTKTFLKGLKNAAES